MQISHKVRLGDSFYLRKCLLQHNDCCCRSCEANTNDGWGIELNTMMKLGRLQQWAFVLRILCVVALVSVGLTHKIPVFASSLEEHLELSSYELPDGTFPIFCLTDVGDPTSKQPQSSRSGCDACRISGSVILPAPECGAISRLLRANVLTVRKDYSSCHEQRLPSKRSPRAPPFQLSIA